MLATATQSLPPELSSHKRVWNGDLNSQTCEEMNFNSDDPKTNVRKCSVGYEKEPSEADGKTARKVYK